MKRRTIERLYREHGHAVLRRARQIVGDETEARDVLQDVFAALVERPDQFGERSAITTWLYSVTTHACLNRLRNARNRARLLESNVTRLRLRAAAATSEQSAMVREVLAGLPEEQAQVAIYYYVDQMTQQEIATLMGCSRRHVGDLLERMQRTARKREQIA